MTWIPTTQQAWDSWIDNNPNPEPSHEQCFFAGYYIGKQHAEDEIAAHPAQQAVTEALELFEETMAANGRILCNGLIHQKLQAALELIRQEEEK
jgi:hypothetical protein